MARTKRERRLRALLAKSAPTETPQATEQLPRLLRLPAELRNRIYDYVMIDIGKLETAEIRQGIIINTPSLPQTCQQLRNEFLPIFNAALPSISSIVAAYVHNFDYEGLMTWLERLPRDVLNNVQKEGSFRIRFTFDPTLEYCRNVESVRNWLLLCLENPNLIPKRSPKIYKQPLCMYGSYSFTECRPEEVGFNKFDELLRARLSEDTEAEWAEIARAYKDMRPRWQDMEQGTDR